MSDSKKLTVSEIRALVIRATVNGGARTKLLYVGVPYLLDLVKRMGDALEEYGDHTAPCDVSDTACTCGWEKARALLEEVKK